MKTIPLPGSLFRVSQLAYGTADMGTRVPTEEGFHLLDLFAEAGGNFLDTAHCYSAWIEGGAGVSEAFLGAYLKRAGRNHFVVATKGGHCAFDGYPRPERFLDPALVAKDMDESLSRLGLDQVDLYYLHRDDPRIPVGEIVAATNELIRTGKTLAIGASNWSAKRVLDANAYASSHGLQPFCIVQNQFSLAKPNWQSLDAPGDVRYVLDEERQVFANAGIPIAAWSPTATGFFAKGESATYGTPEGMARLERARNLALEIGATPNQVALAFLLNLDADVVPILGTGNPAHLQDALGALQIRLTAPQMAYLES